MNALQALTSRFSKRGRPAPRFGVIQTSIFKYITPKMIFIIATVFALITMNFDTLYTNYETNIPLNSLIFIIFFMAIIQSLKSNINVYHAAHLLKGIETLKASGIVKSEGVDALRVSLETNAFLLNTQNMSKVLDNLERYGCILITDNDARLIKSKLGFRIRGQRSGVTFMGGVLVMLGLIGTFWGLLLTIAAVGEALDVIAVQAGNMGSEDDDGGGIGAIIGSISAPLQGMGLAFSSSLFGLAGSLVVGFFGYACGQSHDMAIEDFSRWIDDNIPKIGTEEEKMLQLSFQGLELEDKDDGKPLAFSDGSSNNNTPTADHTHGSGIDDTVASQIIFAIRDAAKTNSTLNANFEALLSAQQKTNLTLEKSHDHAQKMHDAQQAMTALLTQIHDNQTTQNTTFSTIEDNTHKLVKADVEIFRVVSNHQSLMEDMLAQAQSNTTTTTAMMETITAQKSVFDNIDASTKATATRNEDMIAILNKKGKILSTISKHIEQSNAVLQNSDTHLTTMQENHTAIARNVHDIQDKISATDGEAMRRATFQISQDIKAMDASLQENAAIMRDLAKEGNVKLMNKILKDMELLWLKMKQGER